MFFVLTQWKRTLRRRGALQPHDGPDPARFRLLLKIGGPPPGGGGGGVGVGLVEIAHGSRCPPETRHTRPRGKPRAGRRGESRKVPGRMGKPHCHIGTAPCNGSTTHRQDRIPHTPHGETGAEGRGVGGWSSWPGVSKYQSLRLFSEFFFDLFSLWLNFAVFFTKGGREGPAQTRGPTRSQGWHARLAYMPGPTYLESRTKPEH